MYVGTIKNHIENKLVASRMETCYFSSRHFLCVINKLSTSVSRILTNLTDLGHRDVCHHLTISPVP